MCACPGRARLVARGAIALPTAAALLTATVLLTAAAPAELHAQTQLPPNTQKINIVEPPAPLLPRLAGSGAGQLSADEVSRAAVRSLTPESFDEASCLPLLSTSGTPAGGSLNAGKPGSCLAILREDGLLRVAATRYHHAAGDGGVAVAAFEFDDATGAFSAYTLFRSRMHGAVLSSSDRKALDAATESSTGTEGSLVWSGAALLRTGRQLSAADLAVLIGTLPKASGRRSLAPLLPVDLPAGGLDRADIRYALGPASYAAMRGVVPDGVIDWGRSAEAATGSYTLRGGKGTLTLLLFPTPQIAGAQGRLLGGKLNELPAAERAARFGTIKLRRIGPMLALVTGALEPARAEELVQAVHLNEEVTFDKPQPPEFHAEIQKTATLLQNIAAFVGVMLVAAVLLALFLGGARAGIRKLQGKPAASEPEFLTINLRGRQQPIHRSDEPRAGEPAPSSEPFERRDDSR